ncbi:MAG: hypothetical protein ABTD50_06445 [Polyangiaceae bacterium]
MAMNRAAQLEAIRRELQRQDREWARAMKPLTQAGGAQLSVPQAWIDAMDSLVQPPRPSIAGIRA